MGENWFSSLNFNVIKLKSFVLNYEEKEPFFSFGKGSRLENSLSVL